MRPNILVIAGHDPSGGAGIHADIEAIQSTGGFASTLITALTVQNSRKVSSFQLTPLELLEQQADALLADYEFQAVKIGMTGSVATVEWIARLLARLPGVPVVLDPVLAAESGGSLAQESLAEAMLEKLAPAILAGMPAIVKSASQTCYLTEKMVAAMIESGLLPKGVLQLICGSVGDLFEHLGSQDVVTFTG